MAAAIKAASAGLAMEIDGSSDLSFEADAVRVLRCCGLHAGRPLGHRRPRHDARKLERSALHAADPPRAARNCWLARSLNAFGGIATVADLRPIATDEMTNVVAPATRRLQPRVHSTSLRLCLSDRDRCVFSSANGPASVSPDLPQSTSSKESALGGDRVMIMTACAPAGAPTCCAMHRSWPCKHGHGRGQFNCGGRPGTANWPWPA
eukprot:365707-Chlamydomonas_euryale.AAC.13